MKPHAHATRRPARPGITTVPQPKMAAYLAGAVGTAALLGAPQAEAAVTAVTFGFGSQFDLSDGTGSYRWTVGSLGYLKAYASGSSLSLGYHPLSSVGGMVYHNAAGGSNSGLVRFFANSTVIGGGGNGAKGYAYFQSSNSLLDLDSDLFSKNIGFKTSGGNWGWANVDWLESTKTLKINEAWVESVANTPITINVAAVPEPSRALLALAGLGGVALRRRRKQVA